MQLVVHVGAGKTGTSAIQHALAAHPQALAAQRARYLGLMLEHAPAPPAGRRAWQKASASEVFHGLPRDRAVRELGEVLRAAVVAAAADGVRTLVWSNESLFDRHDRVDPVLAQLAAQGLRVRPVAYVRDPVAWTRSAHEQWALKHKTRPGPVRRFADWAPAHAPRFAHVLAGWAEAWGDALVVRNHDAVDDVVPDFLRACGLDPAPFATVRANEALPAHELLLRALFNDRLADPALPRRFDRAMAPGVPSRRTPQEQLDDWMPDAAAIQALDAQLQDERARMDALLAAHGQPPVRAFCGAPRAAVDESRLLMLVCEMVVAQAVRIDRLERRIQAADERGGSEETARRDATVSSPLDNMREPAARSAAGVARSTTPAPSSPSRNAS